MPITTAVPVCMLHFDVVKFGVLGKKKKTFFRGHTYILVFEYCIVYFIFFENRMLHKLVVSVLMRIINEYELSYKVIRVTQKISDFAS